MLSPANKRPAAPRPVDALDDIPDPKPSKSAKGLLAPQQLSLRFVEGQCEAEAMDVTHASSSTTVMSERCQSFLTMHPNFVPSHFMTTERVPFNFDPALHTGFVSRMGEGPYGTVAGPVLGSRLTWHAMPRDPDTGQPLWGGGQVVVVSNQMMEVRSGTCWHGLCCVCLQKH